MSWLGNLLRRARLRGLAEGKVQTVRAEALEDDAKDDCERWQDYGFASRPGEGQGLVLNAGGHTIVLRMDRIADRPQLAVDEVTIWHRSGSRVTLKAGQLVQVDCAELVVNASTKVTLNTPTVETPTSFVLAGKELAGHVHSGVTPGGASTGPNV